MQLVFVAGRCCTTFEVRYIAVFVGNNKCAFELAGIYGVDTEVGRQFHRAAYAFGNVNKRSVAENCRVQGCKKIVGHRYYRRHVFLNQIRVMFYCFAERAENNSLFGKGFFESCFYRNTVHNRIYGNARERHLFFERNAKLVECFQQFRIHFIEAFGSVGAWRCVIGYALVIYCWDFQMCPVRHFHRCPVTVCFQSVFEHPFGFVFFCRNDANNIFVEPDRDDICFNVSCKSVFVIGLGYFV